MHRWLRVSLQQQRSDYRSHQNKCLSHAPLLEGITRSRRDPGYSKLKRKNWLPVPAGKVTLNSPLLFSGLFVTLVHWIGGEWVAFRLILKHVGVLFHRRVTWCPLT